MNEPTCITRNCNGSPRRASRFCERCLEEVTGDDCTLLEAFEIVAVPSFALGFIIYGLFKLI